MQTHCISATPEARSVASQLPGTMQPPLWHPRQCRNAPQSKTRGHRTCCSQTAASERPHCPTSKCTPAMRTGHFECPAQHSRRGALEETGLGVWPHPLTPMLVTLRAVLEAGLGGPRGCNSTEMAQERQNIRPTAPPLGLQTCDINDSEGAMPRTACWGEYPGLLLLSTPAGPVVPNVTKHDTVAAQIERTHSTPRRSMS